MLPPQSMPASSPFWMPSVHFGFSQTPAQHTPLVQSRLTLQPAPAAHRGQLGRPPQSTSVSLSFLIPSEHVGGAHLPLTQTWCWQSAGLMHP
jgi:hypothetical protein